MTERVNLRKDVPASSTASAATTAVARPRTPPLGAPARPTDGPRDGAFADRVEATAWMLLLALSLADSAFLIWLIVMLTR